MFVLQVYESSGYNKTGKRKATLGFPIFRTDKLSFFRGFKDGLSVRNIGKLQVAFLFAVLLLMSTFLSWIKQQNLVVLILYKNNEIEGVVLNKVYILQIFYSIKIGKGQGSKPTMAHMYLKIGRNLVKMCQ